MIDEGGCGLNDEGIHVAISDVVGEWGSSMEYLIARPQDSET